MVCVRCKMVVKAELVNLSVHFKTVELGEVEVIETLTAEQTIQLKEALLQSAFELMDDKKSVLIQQIKK